MVRLAVHGGTHATDWPMTRRQLTAWREPLARCGVRLHPVDQPEPWQADALRLLDGKPSAVLIETVERASREEAAIVLLSAERLEDALRDGEKISNLMGFAHERALSVGVVLVLRDQLGYLNQLYCERVSHLQMARDFESFVADPSPAGRFDYATAFSALLRTADLDVQGVRYDETDPAAAAGAVLVAAGVPAKDVAALAPPRPVPRPTLPGPVLVAAHRLLFKRLWRLGLHGALPRRRLAAAATALRDQAAAGAWDSTTFWGWDPASRAAAITSYTPGNDQVAEALWGERWGDNWAAGTYEPPDLASVQPSVVVDVLDTIDAIVAPLQAEKGTTRSQ